MQKDTPSLTEACKKSNDVGLEWIITGIAMGLPGSIALHWTIDVFNIWNWVGIFWPEAYAVHKFLM